MIDLLIPSRGRYDRLCKTLVSAKETATNPNNLHAIIYLDEDDALNYGNLHILNRTTVITGQQDILSKNWNTCFNAGKGTIIMHCADDIIFKSRGWDIIVESHFKDNKASCLYGMDGHQDKNCATHSFTLRRAADIIEHYLPPYFSADWNDVWLMEVYKKLGRLNYEPSIVIKHLHVNVDAKYNDATYRLAEQRRHEASLVFENKKHEIDDWVAKLINYL